MLFYIFTNIILLMQDKIILNEFAAKISKAKILYDTTSANCDKLRREAAQLQREYEQVRSQRESAETLEATLKFELEQSKNMYKSEN